MRSKRPSRSLIVCVSCAMVGCILTSTAYSRRVNDLETERDIYASKSSNWERMAGERDETIDQLQTEVDKQAAEFHACQMAGDHYPEYRDIHVKRTEVLTHG